MSETTPPVADLAEELEAARERIRRLELALEDARDHALAAEAQVGRVQADREEIRDRLRAVREDRDRAIAEVDLLRRTTTWRVGNAIVKPVARMRRHRPEA